MWIAYAVLGLVMLVGFRLIALGVRLRSAPELALGVALAALKPGAVLLDHGMRAQLPGLITVGLACATTGTAAVGCFAQLTFRRREAWAQGLLALLVAFLLYAHALALTQLQTTGTPSILYLSSRMVLLGWAATEALLHRAAYAKRAVIGLAKPIVANRFLLFSAWIGSMAFNSSLLVLIVWLDQRFGLFHWQDVMITIVRVMALIDLTLMALIFVAPRSYVAWIERRHERRLAQAAVTP